jgi:hypothetical protein
LVEAAGNQSIGALANYKFDESCYGEKGHVAESVVRLFVGQDFRDRAVLLWAAPNGADNEGRSSDELDRPHCVGLA